MRDPELELALGTLRRTPVELDDLSRLVPIERWTWEPSDWEGFPGERFSALGQLCHLRDIEVDGYHVRIRRMVEEPQPDLVSLDGYELARERRYGDDDPARALGAFQEGRRRTLAMLAQLDAALLDRRATFAEHGAITLRALIHYLCSHDRQHLACMHWLLGRIRSSPRS